MHASLAPITACWRLKPPIAPQPLPGLAIVEDAPVTSLGALAERYERVVRESLEAFADGTLAAKPDAEARAALLAGLVDAGVLDLSAGAAPELASCLNEWARLEAALAKGYPFAP